MAYRKVYRRKPGAKRAPKRVMRKSVMRKGKSFRKTGATRIRVKSLGLNTSFSKIALRPNKFGKMMRKKYWLGARNTYITDTLSQITTTSGIGQDYAETGYCSKNDIYQAIAQLANSSGSVGNANNNARYFVNKCTAETIFTNSSNTNVEIDIYTFSTKRDSGTTPGQLFFQSMENQTTQVLTDYSRYYGTSPLDCPEVNALYKCYKITHIQLNPGQSHRHSFTYHIARPISNEVMKNANDQVLLDLRGITQRELFVARSTSIASGTGGVGEAFAPVKVNWNINKKYELKYLFDNNSNMSLTYSTPSTTGNQIYNQGTGAAATPAVI